MSFLLYFNAYGPLHGKAPPLKIHPNSSYGHINSVLVFDQLPNCVPCPQTALHLQLIWILIGDYSHKLFLLIGCQRPFLSGLPSSCLGLQRDHTPAFVIADRLTDRPLAETGYFYNLLHRLLFLDH